MPGGRPTDYNKQIALEICDAIATGSKGLTVLCRENKHWPAEDTVYKWRNRHKEFAEMYANAKHSQVEVFINEIVEISDKQDNDIIIDENGNERLNKEYLLRSRLRVDTRKWIAQKLAPRLYGDKVFSENLHVVKTHEDWLDEMQRQLDEEENG